MEKIGFITGKLAAPSLDRVVGSIAGVLGFEPAIIPAPISVAALMTTSWLRDRVTIPKDLARVVLPGWCTGDLGILRDAWQVAIERGPKDLRDLPEHFQHPPLQENYGDYDIEIFAEINHANRLEFSQLLDAARRLRSDGADFVDLGCTPGERWEMVGECIKRMREAGIRSSIDSFDAEEARLAAAAGCEAVLSVNSSNRAAAVDWGCAVVVIPDRLDETWLESMTATAEYLESNRTAFWLDPILEPIGIGFAASLGRYLETRRAFPEARMFMGVGNLTELTEADSAGVNAVLTGFCQELRIAAVLTTEVIHWAQSSVRELDVARRLMKFAVDRGIAPKHVDGRLVTTRGGKPVEPTAEELAQLKAAVRDRNIRIQVAGGRLHLFNRDVDAVGVDAFEMFERFGEIDAGHAFYLGWEAMKATLALQLGKRYVQDESLNWGLLTVDEVSHRERKRNQ